MKLRSVVLVELQQSQYAQSILKKRASSGIVHHVGKYDILFTWLMVLQTQKDYSRLLTDRYLANRQPKK